MVGIRPGEKVNREKTGLSAKLRRLLSIPFVPRPKKPSAAGTRSRLRMAFGHGATGRLGQAFWDIHQGTVEYHIIPHQPYHSYIEGDGFRIETDNEGRPLLFELTDSANALGVNGLVRPSVESLPGDRSCGPAYWV